MWPVCRISSRKCQKAVDSKLAALQESVQQALDTANKTSSSVSSLNNGVTQTMRTELKGVQDQLSNVTGLSTKVDGIANGRLGSYQCCQEHSGCDEPHGGAID